MEPGYERHVFFCGHERTPGHKRGDCKSKSSLEMMTKLKRRTREEGIENIRVQKLKNNSKKVSIFNIFLPLFDWFTFHPPHPKRHEINIICLIRATINLCT